jgi:hypothetical protein
MQAVVGITEGNYSVQGTGVDEKSIKIELNEVECDIVD